MVTGGELSTGVKKLGKDRRALTLDVDYVLSSNKGDAVENSTTLFAASGSEDVRNLLYDRSGSHSSVNASVNYVEPFGKCWALSATLTSGYSVRKSTSDATNAVDGSANDYYSSVSDNYYFSNEGKLLAQYRKGKVRRMSSSEGR